MSDHLGVGLGREGGASGRELVSQLVEILDDAVVDDGDAVGRVRMRVVLVGPAMGRPAGVADADRAGERLAPEPLLEILELAFGAPAREVTFFQGGDARRVITTVFEALERIDHQGRDRLTTQYPDDPAHVFGGCPCLGHPFGSRRGLSRWHNLLQSRRISVRFSP